MPKKRKRARLGVKIRIKRDAPKGAAAAVVALDRNTCRWPIGDPRDPDFRFCCAKCKPDSAYCEGHWEQSVDQWTLNGRRDNG